MSQFRKGLSDEFLRQLAEEANNGSWWTDVLNDYKLFIGIRDNRLNVYWHGQSLFSVRPGLKVSTHVKFLVDPKLKEQVQLVGGKFELSALEVRGFISEYKDSETLNKMKTAASLFAGREKKGCHEVILFNPNVIDREIAFPGILSPNDGDSDGRPGQMDLLSLEPEDGTARLVFWEAKHFTNGELRALGPDVAVCKQIARYRKYLREHRDEIEASYKRVVKDLVALDKMRRGVNPGFKPLPSLISEVIEGRPLTLGTEPKVGLVIFGFDKAQRDHPDWRHHLKRLEEDVEVARVVAAGDPKNIQLKL